MGNMFFHISLYRYLMKQKGENKCAECFSHISSKQGKTKLWKTFDISDCTFRDIENENGIQV